MKRATLAMLGISMLVGCATSHKSAATLAPAGPAKADYFEVNKNGQTYVFNDVKTLQSFTKTGNSGPTVTDYYGSKLVSFQATGDERRLVAEYEKQHK